MMPELWAVVPMRGFARGKTRLAGALDPAARTRLNRWLFARTLDVIEAWRGDLARCVIVSRCPEVYAIAARRGAPVVCEAQDPSDQNRAASAGGEYALQQGAARLVLLPCDLPDMTVDALDALTADAHRERHMTIAPDMAGTGTNAVVLDAQAHTNLCFGAGSYARYLAWAESRDWTVSVCARPELTFDLDTPEDWAAWNARNALGSSAR